MNKRTILLHTAISNHSVTISQVAVPGKSSLSMFCSVSLKCILRRCWLLTRQSIKSNLWRKKTFMEKDLIAEFGLQCAIQILRILRQVAKLLYCSFGFYSISRMFYIRENDEQNGTCKTCIHLMPMSDLVRLRLRIRLCIAISYHALHCVHYHEMAWDMSC